MNSTKQPNRMMLSSKIPPSVSPLALVGRCGTDVTGGTILERNQWTRRRNNHGHSGNLKKTKFYGSNMAFYSPRNTDHYRQQRGTSTTSFCTKDDSVNRSTANRADSLITARFNSQKTKQLKNGGFPKIRSGGRLSH